MSEGDDFAELIRRIRTGDALAARELSGGMRRRFAAKHVSASPLAATLVRLDGPLPVRPRELFVRVVAGHYEESPAT